MAALLARYQAGPENEDFMMSGDPGTPGIERTDLTHGDPILADARRKALQAARGGEQYDDENVPDVTRDYAQRLAGRIVKAREAGERRGQARRQRMEFKRYGPGPMMARMMEGGGGQGEGGINPMLAGMVGGRKGFLGAMESNAQRRAKKADDDRADKLARDQMADTKELAGLERGAKTAESEARIGVLKGEVANKEAHLKNVREQMSLENDLRKSQLAAQTQTGRQEAYNQYTARYNANRLEAQKQYGEALLTAQAQVDANHPNLDPKDRQLRAKQEVERQGYIVPPVAPPIPPPVFSTGGTTPSLPTAGGFGAFGGGQPQGATPIQQAGGGGIGPFAGGQPGGAGPLQPTPQLNRAQQRMAAGVSPEISDQIDNAPKKADAGGYYDLVDFVNLYPDGTPASVIRSDALSKGWTEKDIKVLTTELQTNMFYKGDINEAMRAVELMTGRKLTPGMKREARTVSAVPVLGPLASGLAGEIMPGSMWRFEPQSSP